jgi:hypothetical protein
MRKSSTIDSLREAFGRQVMRLPLNGQQLEKFSVFY